SSSRTSRNRAGNCTHYLAFARCAVRSQVHTNRKTHARRDDVDSKCDRGYRGYYRLDEKVIAWEEFVCGRGGGWCWRYSARSSLRSFIAGSHSNACNTLCHWKSSRHRRLPRRGHLSSVENWTPRNCSMASHFIHRSRRYLAPTQRPSVPRQTAMCSTL